MPENFTCGKKPQLNSNLSHPEIQQSDNETISTGLTLDDFCLVAPDHWRYCKVGKPGVSGDALKRPFERDWPTKTYDQHAIKTAFKSGKCQGFGLVAGNSLILLDVDGELASARLKEVAGSNEIPVTVGWTSGKQGRFQLAFNLTKSQQEELVAAHLGAGGKANKGRWYEEIPTGGGDVEQLDFRWAGHQSVLPPSPHPETDGYYWIEGQSPADIDVAVMPGFLFDYLLTLVAKPPRDAKQKQASGNNQDAIPLETCIAKANRELLNGIGEGSRNDNGAKLARDLIGTEEYLLQAGYRVEQSAHDLFSQYCRNCTPPLDDKEADQIWKSAEGDKPGPSLSADKIENCIKGWQRRQSNTGSNSKPKGRPKKEPAESSGGTKDAINFNFLVVDLYSDTRWISVNGRLYRWADTFYQEQSDELQLARIQNLAENTAVYDEEKDRNTWPFAKVSVVKSALDWVANSNLKCTTSKSSSDKGS